MRQRTTRIPAPVALVVILVLAAAAMAACKNGVKPGETQGNVVVHALDSKSDHPHPDFSTAPGGPGGPLPTGHTVKGKLTAQSFTGTPTVGPLFLDAGGVAVFHYCTASVVRSDAGYLIATAAHCVYSKTFGGFQNHILFVPGYHDKAAPYGMWVATTAYVDQRWITSGDPDYDVAFLTVRRVASDTGASNANDSLESMAGSDQFLAKPGYSTAVDVVAYPMGGTKPVSCAARTTQHSATQLRFSCGGFAEGSSGAPFLTADGAMVGVVGGYQEGGATADVSYSSYFGDGTAALYQAAASAG